MGREPAGRLYGTGCPRATVFFYFIVVMLHFPSSLIDLKISDIFITPIAVRVGIGVGAGIAIFLGFSLKYRAPEMMDDILGRIRK